MTNLNDRIDKFHPLLSSLDVTFRHQFNLPIPLARLKFPYQVLSNISYNIAINISILSDFTSDQFNLHSINVLRVPVKTSYALIMSVCYLNCS